MKAALSRAAGYIAPNHFENAPRTCIECGAPLESWQASRCQACIDKSLTQVVVANSARWLTEHEHPVKPDGMSDDDWNEYQQWVAEELAAPYPALTPEYLEIAGCYSPREC